MKVNFLYLYIYSLPVYIITEHHFGRNMYVSYSVISKSNLIAQTDINWQYVYYSRYPKIFIPMVHSRKHTEIDDELISLAGCSWCNPQRLVPHYCFKIFFYEHW